MMKTSIVYYNKINCKTIEKLYISHNSYATVSDIESIIKIALKGISISRAWWN